MIAPIKGRQPVTGSEIFAQNELLFTHSERPCQDVLTKPLRVSMMVLTIK